MKLGVLTVPFAGETIETTVEYLSKLGVQAVELGTGGFTNDSHCRLDEILADTAKAKQLKAVIEDHGMSIAALSCHGNPVHPDVAVAKHDHEIYAKTLKAAELLDVDTVVTFSGCPGGHPKDVRPNWVTCAWPTEFGEILEYQWNECLLPYWEKAAKMAENSGVKIALEMHPGFCVYNSETMLKLRKNIGETVGANFDPSHLFWQGTDAVSAINELGNAIHYVHAKDCRIDRDLERKHGVLDTKTLADVKNRSWIFRTVGYGHDEKIWRDIISALKINGYDKVVSIEHEDALMSVREGVEKAVKFLKEIIIMENNNAIWWA